MVWVLIAVLLLAPSLLARSPANGAAVTDLVARGWRRVRRRGPLPSTPPPVPVEAFEADLRRLVAFIDQLHRSDAPALAARLQAALIAYDDVLLTACRALEIPAPDRAPLGSLCRLQTEADLVLHGLQW